MIDSAPSPLAPSPSGPAPAPSGPDSAPPTPKSQLTLDPNLTSKAKGDLQCKPGDTYKTTVTVRATDSGAFDVVDVDKLQPVDSMTGPAEDPDVLNEDQETNILGYKRPQKSLAGPVVN